MGYTFPEDSISPHPEARNKIQTRKPLILGANLPSAAEGDWLLAQLDRRGLLYDERDAAGGHAGAQVVGADRLIYVDRRRNLW